MWRRTHTNSGLDYGFTIYADASLENYVKGNHLGAPLAGINIDVTYDKMAPYLDDPVFVKPGSNVQVRKHTK